jgi:hypothetical protein
MINVATHRQVLGGFTEDMEFVEIGPRPKVVAPAPDPEPGPPNLRIVNDGSQPQGSRCYTKGDGWFHFRGDVVMALAQSDPVPGSPMADYLSRCARKRPIFESLRELGPEDRERLRYLRHSPYEPSAAQKEQREQMRAMLVEQLAALG